MRGESPPAGTSMRRRCRHSTTCSILSSVTEHASSYSISPGVSFLDSTGLRSIVRTSRLLAGSGGRLTVAGLSATAERVLQLTGVLEGLRDPDSS